MSLFGAPPFFDGGPSGDVTLTGFSVNVLWTQYAGITVGSNGYIYKIDDTGTNLVNTSTDWVIPHGDNDGLYEVRVTNVVDTGGVGGDWDTKPTTDDTWIAISSNRTWQVKGVAEYGADSMGRDFDMEIRYDGGPVLATASFSLFSGGS